jgi:hypothetical protein
MPSASGQPGQYPLGMEIIQNLYSVAGIFTAAGG